jgi:superfamily II DNA/RNA helicase
VARIVAQWRKRGYLSDVDQRVLTCALQNMRMSCDSTYLLDRTADHGTKADELMNVLAELLQEPQAKVVIFSQWVGMQEVIARRLETAGWEHVMFHGSIPSDKRPALIDRFRNDPRCRVFLSTDAGGVGLNLQHSAAAVVNMDLPWNPAVLEQRIGRVHRLGQTRSVQVVNFVAQGTIEEGMLSVLAFKKSLFAGVLDGGDANVFMQGTRLSKFMESVEKVTSAMGEPEPVAEPAPLEEQPAVLEEASDEIDEEPTFARDSAEAAGAAAAELAAQKGGAAEPIRMPDTWAPLVNVGVKLMQTLAEQLSGRDGVQQWIETDTRTGRPYLKLPVPEPAAVQRVADALNDLLSGWRRE